MSWYSMYDICLKTINKLTWGEKTTSVRGLRELSHFHFLITLLLPEFVFIYLLNIYYNTDTIIQINHCSSPFTR